MQRSNIEYLTHVWNFQTGCKNQESGICDIPCWARHIANRFHRSFEPQLHFEKVTDPLNGKTGGRRIGVCFTGDLFGDWVILNEYQKTVINSVIRDCPNDTFFFLTKCPWNLEKWGSCPDNTYFGASTTGDISLSAVMAAFIRDTDKRIKHRWISFEPLLYRGLPNSAEYMTILQYLNIEWVVIGSQTKPDILPDKKMVDDIVYACEVTNTPYFLKNNLVNGFHKNGVDIPRHQELPK